MTRITTLLKRLTGYQKNEDDRSQTTSNISVGTSDLPYIAAIIFYLGVILFVGLPAWFYTCSITRYSIPNLNHLETELKHADLSLHLDISVVQLSKIDNQKSVNNYHDSNDAVSTYLRSHLPGRLDTSNKNISYDISWRVRRPTLEESTIFRKRLSRYSGNESIFPLGDLETELMNIHRTSSRFRLFMYLIAEQDYSKFCDPTRVHSFTINSERFVYLCPSIALYKPNDFAPLVSLIKDVLSETYSETVDFTRVGRVLEPQSDILFSFIPESTDYPYMDHLSILADKLHHIFEKNIRQKYPELKDLVNIRPITQNLYDLFDSNSMIRYTNSSSANTTDNTELEMRSIQEDKLGQLIRSFESRLSKHSSKNVHHVILIVPKTGSLRIFIEGRSRESVSQATILEGEDNGSILIVNDDKSLVLGLRAIVRRLVGLSNPNICKDCLVRRDIFFCRWEIDAIMGSLTMMKLQNVLTSLKSISQQVTGIKIPKEVSIVVKNAYELSHKSVEKLKSRHIYEAHALADRAFELSEAAFYNPSLIESLYFPEDLKYAIYLPFFLPLAYPITVSIIKLLKFTAERFITSTKDKLKSN